MKVFSTKTKIGKYTSSKGVAMNMNVSRHMKTRTFKSDGKSTLAASLTQMGADSNLEISTSADNSKDARQEVLPKIKSSIGSAVSADRAVVNTIYNDPKWKISDEVKNRAISAESKVRSQNNTKWPEVFG